MSGRTLRYILVGALALAIGIPSVAVGFGEGRSLLLGKRNPSPNAARALNSETEIIASNGSYGTRQSNKRNGDGGGAIYGCRSDTGREPCIRSNNLKTGRAFEFVTSGKEAGRIEVGDTTGAPFTTNATGTATGLNADKVDGKEAADFANAGDLLSARVGGNGALAGGRGATAAAIDDRPGHLPGHVQPRRVAVHLQRDAAGRRHDPDARRPGGLEPAERSGRRRRGDPVPAAGDLLS